jgi:hypothetical protein
METKEPDWRKATPRYTSINKSFSNTAKDEARLKYSFHL